MLTNTLIHTIKRFDIKHVSTIKKLLFGLMPLDLLLCVISFMSSWVLCHNSNYPISFKQPISYLPLILLVRLFFFWYFRMYNGTTRFASVEDLLSILKAIVTSSIILILLTGLFSGFVLIRPAVFIIDTALLVCFIGGVRFFYRVLKEVFLHSRIDATKCLIVGAGGAGARVIREIKQHPELHYKPVGFLDNDSNRQNLSIHGVPVLGKLKDIVHVIKRYQVEEVFIVFDWNAKRRVIKLIKECRELSVRFKIVNNISTSLNGKSALNFISSIEMGDLLERDLIDLDTGGMISLISGRCVMVTGAAGSIGSELCRQLLNYEPKTLVLFENAENNLYDLELELRKKARGTQIIPVVGDIKDVSKVEMVLKKYGPSIIYHAAAHKQVPLMEMHPEEAIKNNITGTKTMALAAHMAKVEAFVFISTDKAVNPTSVMGASKKVSEMFVEGLNEYKECKFITVRFGNVLDSIGSVVPIFKKQILNGGPITVTHPDMERFFMTIPEASQLVIQASALGKGGEIFVLNMGEQMKIVDLAKNLITFCGLKPGTDIDIVFTGLRPGEKLREELFDEEETMQESQLRNISVVKNKNNGRNWHNLNRYINELEKLSMSIDREGIIFKLKEIVTNYQPPSHTPFPAKEEIA